MAKKKEPELLTDQQEASHEKSLIAKLRGYLITGVLVTAPILLTFYLVVFIISIIDRIARYFMPAQNNMLDDIPGIGLVISILFLITVGWFARNLLGKKLYNLSERIVHRIPMINTIYAAIKQVFHTILTPQSQSFKKVVMVPFPIEGMWAMGFLTNETTLHEDPNLVTVYLPTPPNPTAGLLVFVPRDKVVNLDVTVDEGIKTIVSCGLIVNKKPKLPANVAKTVKAASAPTVKTPVKKTAKKPAKKTVPKT